MRKRPVLIWFCDDLRLGDHPALAAAARSDAAVIPVFVLDDASAGSWRYGGASRWWLHRSLGALSRDLASLGSRLVLRRGETRRILIELARETGAAAVYCSRGVTPGRRRLETALKSDFDRLGVAFRRFGGCSLRDPEELRTQSGDPYRVFSPFWKAASKTYNPGPRRDRPDALAPPECWPESDALSRWELDPASPNWAEGWDERWRPGETGASDALGNFVERGLKTYREERDRPDLDATSRLSPHLRFGEISPRDCWRAVSAAAAADAGRAAGGETFLKELGWREFSYYLLHHFPHLPEENFQPKFDVFPWADDKDALRAWRRGQTGYPIVDAGMRELWKTGWMHNRARMITASFLTKHLLIDWRMGQVWFWDTLLDADLANNAASWQWVAGSGADAAPYFRIFNPVLQGEKFDPDGNYVRKWVPEIAALPNTHIHKPWEASSEILAQARIALGSDYPAPIVDHKCARKRALGSFESLKAGAQLR